MIITFDDGGGVGRIPDCSLMVRGVLGPNNPAREVDRLAGWRPTICVTCEREYGVADVQVPLTALTGKPLLTTQRLAAILHVGNGPGVRRLYAYDRETDRTS